MSNHKMAKVKQTVLDNYMRNLAREEELKKREENNSGHELIDNKFIVLKHDPIKPQKMQLALVPMRVKEDNDGQSNERRSRKQKQNVIAKYVKLLFSKLSNFGN